MRAIRERDETEDRETERMLIEIDADGEGLTAWEIGFVSALVTGGAIRFSDDQSRKIEQIHAERVP